MHALDIVDEINMILICLLALNKIFRNRKDKENKGWLGGNSVRPKCGEEHMEIRRLILCPSKLPLLFQCTP